MWRAVSCNKYVRLSANLRTDVLLVAYTYLWHDLFYKVFVFG